MSGIDSDDSFEVLHAPDEEKELQNSKSIPDPDDKAQCLENVPENNKEESFMKDGETMIKANCEAPRSKHIPCQCQNCLNEQQEINCPKTGQVRTRQESDEKNSTKELESNTVENNIVVNKSVTIKENNYKNVDCIANCDKTSLSLSGNANPSIVKESTEVKVLNEGFDEKNMNSSENVVKNSNSGDNHETETTIISVPQNEENFDEDNEINQIKSPATNINDIKDDKEQTVMCCEDLKNKHISCKSVTVKENVNNSADCTANSDNKSLSLSGNVNSFIVKGSTEVKVLSEAEQRLDEKNMSNAENIIENSNCGNSHDTERLIITVPQNKKSLGEDNEINQTKSPTMNINNIKDDKEETAMCCDDLKNKHIYCQSENCFTRCKDTEHPGENQTYETDIQTTIKERRSSTGENNHSLNKSIIIKSGKNIGIECRMHNDNISPSFSANEGNSTETNENTVRALNETEQNFNKMKTNSSETFLNSSNGTNNHGTETSTISAPQINESFNEDNQNCHLYDENNLIKHFFVVNEQQNGMKNDEPKTDMACGVLKRGHNFCDNCLAEHPRKMETHETGVQTIETGWTSNKYENIPESKSVITRGNHNIGSESNVSGDIISRGLSDTKIHPAMLIKNTTTEEEGSEQDLKGKTRNNSEKVLESSNDASIPGILDSLKEDNRKLHSHDVKNEQQISYKVKEQSKYAEDAEIKPSSNRENEDRDRKNKHASCECDKCVTGRLRTEDQKVFQNHETDKPKYIKDPKSNDVENPVGSNEPVTVKYRSNHGVKCSEKNDSSASSIASGSLTSGDTMVKLLTEVKEEFNNECQKKIKQNPSYKEKNTRIFFENPHIKTLGDSIRYFRLSSHVKLIETSLEDVRRNKKKIKEHQDYFYNIDKEIKKLSVKYHTDKVRNRGGTEEDLAIAEKLQAALNATRTALKILNSAFVDDIGTYHKFEFYTKLSITSLCNEDEMKYRIYEVMCEIGVISRIKQENIISEIRKFLIDSRNCIRHYLCQPNDTEKHKMYCNSALRHLDGCIEGFKRLCVEFEAIKEEYKAERNENNLQYLLENLDYESRRDLRILDLLAKTAKISIKGEYQFFIPKEDMDAYFILPLVYYTNVILMCNAMSKKESVWENVKSHARNSLKNVLFDYNFIDSAAEIWKELDHLKDPYYLTAYYTGNILYQNMVLEYIYERRNTSGVYHNRDFYQINNGDIKLEFYYCIQQVNEFLESKFKVEDYNEAVMTNLSMLDLKKCLRMMKEFQKGQQELSKGIQKFKKKSEKIFQKFDDVIEETRELNQKLKEKLEQHFPEEASNIFSGTLEK